MGVTRPFHKIMVPQLRVGTECEKLTILFGVEGGGRSDGFAYFC